MTGRKISGVKVFSATRSLDRQDLGLRATEWLANSPNVDVVEIKVVQSSDNAYHCLTIVVLYSHKGV